ncbi:trypsin-like peptidase domain-containing protein [Arcanobacterium hippocoleae]|uniref:Serine protease PepD n=1 Tax=Arcanobacterium hippocoleae TaxID=149017 RepID=A0ABU1T1U9_9ACTO|nr:trypsin-like peptidase domain-containing protein [Arcanobacterium hippocoleae]MDR6939289.1 putative serine protease PepD [Arcanobacterium hippocoleae]
MSSEENFENDGMTAAPEANHQVESADPVVVQRPAVQNYPGQPSAAAAEGAEKEVDFQPEAEQAEQNKVPGAEAEIASGQLRMQAGAQPPVANPPAIPAGQMPAPESAAMVTPDVASQNTAPIFAAATETHHAHPWQETAPASPQQATMPLIFDPAAVVLEKPRRKRRNPSWFAFISGLIIVSLLSTLMAVGIMTLRYDGTRPAALGKAEKIVAPVVQANGKTPDWEAVAKAVGPAVVAIDTKSSAGTAAGSGVIIDEKGHVLTNDHVISGAKEVWIKLADGRLFEAKLDGTDPATDLAVISFKNPPADLTVAALGTSQDLQVGEAVAAIGNPLGLSSTMTSGIVSALDRPVQTINKDAKDPNSARVVTNAIQLDAAVNPGNSGGPVFDAAGRVIGIASSIATVRATEHAPGGSIGLGFAIPIDLAKNIAAQLIRNGVAEHAYLGVTIRDGVAVYGREQRLGAQVDTVQPGTPAANAKLREGDVIVAVNGRNVVSAVSLTGYIRQYQSGETVTLTIARNGELQELDVVLATRPD